MMKNLVQVVLSLVSLIYLIMRKNTKSLHAKEKIDMILVHGVMMGFLILEFATIVMVTKKNIVQLFPLPESALELEVYLLKLRPVSIKSKKNSVIISERMVKQKWDIA